MKKIETRIDNLEKKTANKHKKAIIISEDETIEEGMARENIPLNQKDEIFFIRLVAAQSKELK